MAAFIWRKQPLEVEFGLKIKGNEAEICNYVLQSSDIDEVSGRGESCVLSAVHPGQMGKKDSILKVGHKCFSLNISDTIHCSLHGNCH